mgnify:CR=1 FL=1
MVPIKKLQKEHADGRRDIFAVKHTVEKTRREMIFYVKGKAVLGNHYHTTFKEHVTLVSGACTLIMQKLDKKGRPVGPIRKENLKAPVLLTMPTHTAYAYVFHAPAILILRIWRSIYDERDINEYRLA